VKKERKEGEKSSGWQGKNVCGAGKRYIERRKKGYKNVI